MFHNFAPTGLPQASALKTHRSQQDHVERSVESAINGILSTNASLKHKLVYNLAHPDTAPLIRSLDLFFAHGLLRADKCYWMFVREFIPSTERNDLKIRWHCHNKRASSLAWLKDSLNRANLHFQMLSFISCAEVLRRTHYDKNACIQNAILLKRICLLVDQLSALEFHIEPPYVFRPEDTPIALPITQIDGTMSPIGSSNSSVINGGIHQLTPNLPLNIHRRVQCPKSLNGSYCEVGRNSFLDGLVTDLPEVDLSKLGTSIEHVVQSDKDQSYILDQMLHRQRRNFTNSEGGFTEEEDDEEDQEKAKEQSRSVSSFIPEDPQTNDEGGQDVLQLLACTALTAPSAGECLAAATLPTVPSCSSLNSSSELIMSKFGESSTTKDDDELSELGEKDVLIEGEVLLEDHEKIKLCLEVCVEDVETVQHLFQLFIGHAAGQPMTRYLLLTDKFVYLLAADQNKDQGFDVVDVKERDFGGISPASAVLEEWPAEVFEQNQFYAQVSLPSIPKKFETLSALPLCDLDHLTVGIGAQVLCFHSKRKKFRVSPYSGHEQRQLVVETGSKNLGKAITSALRKIMKQKTLALMGAKRGSMQAIEASELGVPSPSSALCVSTSHSSHLALVLKRFLRRELGIQRPEIVHNSLCYWHQGETPRERALLERRTSETTTSNGGEENNDNANGLECYMYVRELYQRNWSRRTATSEWRQSYVVLSGSKLYQFSDSTYKFAQRFLNMKDEVEQVYQVNLRNDEKFVFQLDFRDDIQISGDDDDGSPPLSGLQFSCPSIAMMQTWIGTLSLALSQTGEQPLPVACVAVLTETHVVFAQEGVNCLVDGFMRALSIFHIHEIAEICAIRTEFNSALVLRRDNGLDEWMLFREGAELDRLVHRWRQQWKFPVQECSAEENLLNPAFNQLFLQCVRMPDLWHSSDEKITKD